MSHPHHIAEHATPRGMPADASYVNSRRTNTRVVNRQVVNPPQAQVHTVAIAPRVIEHRNVRERPEVREERKMTTKVEYRYTDQVVEVPQIQYVDKIVERKIPQIVEKVVTRSVPVDRVRESVVERPVYRSIPREQVREVCTETLVNVIPVDSHVQVPVGVVVEKQQPVLVAQTVKPVIVEGRSTIDVDVVEYEPEVIHVDIQVAKFVDHSLVQFGERDTHHRVVPVPSAQYNSLLRFLNSHLSEVETRHLPFALENGQVRFLDHDNRWQILSNNVQLHGHHTGAVYTNGVIKTPDLSRQGDAELKATQARLDAEFNAQVSQLQMRNSEVHKRIEAANRRAREMANAQAAELSARNGAHTAIHHQPGLSSSAHVSQALPHGPHQSFHQTRAY